MSYYHTEHPQHFEGYSIIEAAVETNSVNRWQRNFHAVSWLQYSYITEFVLSHICPPVKPTLGTISVRIVEVPVCSAGVVARLCQKKKNTLSCFFFSEANSHLELKRLNRYPGAIRYVRPSTYPTCNAWNNIYFHQFALPPGKQVKQGWSPKWMTCPRAAPR